MLFQRRTRDEFATGIGSLRDVIEIFAILAAGIWAFYTFVYENRIKPAELPPSLVVEATMQRIGAHNGLVAIRLHERIRNVGSTRVQVLGYALYATGQKVFLHAGNYPRRSRAFNAYQDEYEYSAPRVVWREAYVTNGGDPTQKQDISYEPGEQGERDFLFYVASGRYDVIDANIYMRFTKSTKIVPTTLEIDRAGRPRFPVSQRSDTHLLDTTLTSIDISAR